MKRIGYARVSTDEQNLDLQIQALERDGCDRVFTDSGISGSLVSRPGLDRALAALAPGDKLVVWRLDRLGRSLVHLVQLLDDLGRRDVRFKSLCEHIDTSSSGGRLVFHMMAALAEFERTLISERTRAGMAAARAQGKHVGRRPSLDREQCLQALGYLDAGRSPAWTARHFGVTERTLLRLVGRIERNGQEGIVAAQARRA
ncbi:recombinase family protein [Luteimonas huabeiensis]|uniref:recombinase family protein n=1 Tax=Luteimonas huabeiensis TaxID=1244513 RepID=UPI0004633C8F|nr:recombinase family protein [Luteimonas huabeiensis]